MGLCYNVASYGPLLWPASYGKLYVSARYTGVQRFLTKCASYQLDYAVRLLLGLALQALHSA